MTAIIGLLILTGLLAISGIAFLMIGLKLINRLVETNKQLLIVVAGKETKPETLRALVASNKPPQGKLKGIANEKDKKESPVNTDYTLAVGGINEL